MPLQAGQSLVDPRRHEQAFVDLNVTTALAVHIAQSPLRRRAERSHGEAGMVAVAEALRTGQRGLCDDAVEAAYAIEGVDDNLALDLELPLVADVLPLAAGARAEVAARRLDPVLGGRNDLDDLSGDVAAALPDDLDDDRFAGNAAEHVDRLAVEVGHSLPEAAESAEFEGDEPTVLPCFRGRHAVDGSSRLRKPDADDAKVRERRGHGVAGRRRRRNG